MTLLLLFNTPAATSSATGTAFQSFVEAGMFLGNWDIDDYLTFTACTHDDTGAAADADAVPSYAIYEDETAAAIVSGNMAKLGAVTGFYTERVQLTAANGFEVGKCYAVRVEATVGGVTSAMAHSFVVKATKQDVADALKLAPSAGVAAAGSAMALLSGIDSSVDLLLAMDTSTTDATTAGAISRRRGNSWSIPLTIGAITGYTSLWFTIKASHDDADTAALLQIKLNASGLSDGLLYVNGTTASSDALGSITVNNATTGAIVIAVDETITDDLAPGEYYYDVQTLIAGDVATPDSGTFTVTADVTRSVT